MIREEYRQEETRMGKRTTDRKKYLVFNKYICFYCRHDIFFLY